MLAEDLEEKVELKLYNPHPKQLEIAIHPGRFKVVCCGRRFGKTTLAINELLLNALTTSESQYWYIAPTYRQAKSIAWAMLLRAYYQLPAELQKGKNEAELWVEVGEKGRIELKGADNEDSLRGSGLNGIVVDEVASIRNWDYLWHEVLRPALTDKKGWGMFISTPKGFNHFYNLFNRKDTDKDYYSFHYTSYDNPYLPHSEIDKAKLELSEDAFAQEYMADFRKHTGLIYKEFTREVHVIEPIFIPSFWQHYRAMDFGAVNATVCLWPVKSTTDDVYITEEYYNSGQRTEFHANVIKAKSLNLPIIATVGDPSGEQQMIDYGGYDISITPASKITTDNEDWVIHGINEVKNLLKPQSGKPRLYIFKNCANLIREFESYHWKETKYGEQLKDMPEKVDDHCLDALRYFIVTFGGKEERSYGQDIYVSPPNKYTGY